MNDFYDQMRRAQVRWRQQNLQNQEYGRQNRRAYDHILPQHEWELNLWDGIAHDLGKPLSTYLKEKRIGHHSGSHNLLSSWALCANVYFPFHNERGRQMFSGFLQETISNDIRAVTAVKLEYESEDPELKPPVLLGEMDGYQGAGQTSPDVAFEVETGNGPGLVLVECKFTEHSFYRCAGRNPNVHNPIRNEDTTRCKRAADVLSSPEKQCHLIRWNRKYWHHLKPVINAEAFGKLKACPAAFGGYQLFRQQALAEGIARSGNYALIVSAVAYDQRNAGLMSCMARSTGIADVNNDWGALFGGQTKFMTFTHQAWVDWVRNHDHQSDWQDWLGYVHKRYGL